jgi:hypothetical protein
MVLFMVFSLTSSAQLIQGKVVNSFTKEPVSFASVYWKVANQGGITDSMGVFQIKPSPFAIDTIVVNYVGFEKMLFPYTASKAATPITLFLSETKMSEGATVKTKFNKGLRWWRAIVANKPSNNPYRFDNYAYELYNKMEFDLTNFDKKSLQDKKALKPFSFILKNIDSITDAKPFLPVYITEAISQFQYSNNPYKIRETIKAVQTSGIKNETVMQFIGGVTQKINCYGNYMTLFGKEFISPLSDIADRYYNFKGADTQTINQQKYFHLFFTPKQEGSNTFSGDCWIHAKTWAIQKINLTASATADINFVNRLSVVQEFAKTGDSSWMFYKDKVVVDMSPFGKGKFSFIGRRTSAYKNVQIDQASTLVALAKSSKLTEVIITDSAKQQSKNYWKGMRHEDLSSNELKVYQMIDTLKQMPAFKSMKNKVEFILDGHKKLGMVEIGPWYKWVSSNQHEGLRLRFDLGTTEQFSKQLRLYGYAAYGFKDGLWKGKGGFNYKFPHKSGWSVGASYTDDLDNGRIRFIDDENITVDNMFNRLLRRKGLVQKFLGMKELRTSLTKDFGNNMSAKFQFKHSQFETFNPLPHSRMFSNRDMNVLNSELGIKFRFAPGEKVIEGARRDYKLKTHLPVMELELAAGIPNMFNSEYQYQKISAYLTQKFRIKRWGQVDYMLYGGKYFGSGIPFMLLEVHPGNEIYYYNKNSFNLMNRFEYVSDHYVGFNIEHNFEKKLFNLIPFMRKTKMRQFWNLKTVWGGIYQQNRAINRADFSAYYLKRLQENYYTELGTGIDNIFHFFRIDLVWRIVPNNQLQLPLPRNFRNDQTQNFAIFGSFKLQL